MGGKMPYALRDIHGRKFTVGMKLQIGSDPGNQIVLLDPQIAAWQATLWEQQGVLYLRDDSAGGATFANQMHVNGTVVLRPGDQVTTGSTRFTMVDLAAQPAPPAKAPKKCLGCLQWLLIGAGMFLFEILLIAASGFYVYSTDVEIQGTIQDMQANMNTNKLPASDKPPAENQAGPDILNLSDIWLTYSPTSSFTQRESTTVESFTRDGKALTNSFVSVSMQQSSPEWLSYNLVKKISNNKVVAQSESGITKGVFYAGYATCVSSPDPTEGDHPTNVTSDNILTYSLTGHVKRVETGVTVNGVITDRYEIRPDSFVASDAVVEVKSGSLYRAREGGYIVQLDYVVKINPQSWASNMGDEYSTTQQAQVTYHFDRTYVPVGTLTAKVPGVCADKVK
jgi:hypothetical protein